MAFVSNSDSVNRVKPTGQPNTAHQPLNNWKSSDLMMVCNLADNLSPHIFEPMFVRGH